MTSLRQIEANRRNARLSTGPITEEGKRKSRRNALRHGLTAETVIAALEDAEDYAAFELAVTADHDAQSAVERELVLRLASLLWRLRRATAIETGLFKEQARHLLLFRQDKRGVQKNQGKSAEACGSEAADGLEDCALGPQLYSAFEGGDPIDGPTQAFVRLSKLPTYPLDRLSRYEATLWRQARQILVTLRRLDRSKSLQKFKWR
jgi:hypothetical protein